MKKLLPNLPTLEYKWSKIIFTIILVNIKLHKFSNIKIYVQLKSAFYQYTETMNTNKAQWK